ncbi:MAG: hypothetical protein M1823_006522, partial [Watsoniomyces obsoletus]
MSAGGPRTRSQTAAVEDRGRNRSPSAVPSGDDNNPPTPRDETPPNDTAGPRIDPGEDEEQRLNQELEEVRRQRRIAALRKTLEEERRALAAGEVPPAGEVLPERRPAEPRPRSDTLKIAIPTAKRSWTMADESKLRVVDPEPYRGRTQREFTDFIRRCERVFAIREVTYAADREKILLATSYLQGETQD